MNEAQLKACPFCGSPEENGYLKRRRCDFRKADYIHCESCGAAALAGMWNVRPPWMERAGDRQPEAKPNDEAVASSLERVVGESDPRRWIKRAHGKYSRNGDLLTVRTADDLIEELQNTVAALSNE